MQVLKSTAIVSFVDIILCSFSKENNCFFWRKLKYFFLNILIFFLHAPWIWFWKHIISDPCMQADHEKRVILSKINCHALWKKAFGRLAITSSSDLWNEWNDRNPFLDISTDAPCETELEHPRTDLAQGRSSLRNIMLLKWIKFDPIPKRLDV